MEATLTLSILNGIVILLKHLTCTVGECFGGSTISMMNKIRRYHSVEFIQNIIILGKDIVNIELSSLSSLVYFHKHLQKLSQILEDLRMNR
jgi:hypothetical protein